MIINPGIGLNSQFQQTVPVPLDTSLDQAVHILISISSQSIKRSRLVDVASEVSSPARVLSQLPAGNSSLLSDREKMAE